jgi:hypothetical protein
MDISLCSALTEPLFDATDRALCTSGVADQQKVYAQTLQQCAEAREWLALANKATAGPLGTSESRSAAEWLDRVLHSVETLELLSEGTPFQFEVPGLPGLGLMVAAIDSVPKVPPTTHPAPNITHPYSPLSPMPQTLRPDSMQRQSGGTMLNPSPKSADGSDPFVAVNPRDVVIVDPADGSAIFEPADQPGLATFRTSSGTVFLTPTTGDWSQSGVAVFSPLTPIQLTDEATSPGGGPTKQNFISPQPRRNWGAALLQGLQMGLSIYNGVQATKQAARGTAGVPPTTGIGSVQVTKPAITAGSASASKGVPAGTGAATVKPVPTLAAPAMCPNAAAIGNPHGVTVNGPYVTSSNTPSSYVPLLIPCAR